MHELGWVDDTRRVRELLGEPGRRVVAGEVGQSERVLYQDDDDHGVPDERGGVLVAALGLHDVEEHRRVQDK